MNGLNGLNGGAGECKGEGRAALGRPPTPPAASEAFNAALSAAVLCCKLLRVARRMARAIHFCMRFDIVVPLSAARSRGDR